ncbi:condensation domain-containing protein, partial [Maribacter sp. 2-571]|uniref:condensation domain-containing protein n=1 Tax=Maribacter sp. 2-571 TaxID=3417569 RepID=UPI003D3320E8
RPFDLEKEYPLRVCFYEVLDKEGESDRYVLIMMHHIASDGWSEEVFTSELDSYYRAYTSGDTAFELPELPIQYSDYAVWERAALTGEVLSEKLSYWETRLSGFETLSLPTDHTRPAVFDYKGNSLEFVISEHLSIELRELAQSEGVTLNSLMLSSVAVLLGKYANQDDILIGSPHANRDHYQTGGLIGFFINTLVNRVRLDKGQSFIDLIKDVHRDQVDAQSHRDFPFEQLIDHLSIEQNTSRHPLFQVLFSLQSFGQKEVDTLSEYLQPVPLEDGGHQIEKLDMTIYMDDSNTGIAVQISYATSLFAEETIERMARHYLVLLESLVTNDTTPYLSHSLLDASNYQTMVHD